MGAASGARSFVIQILGDSKGATDAADQVSSKFGALKEHMGAVAGAIGGALTVAAVTSFAKSSIDAFQSVAGEVKGLQRVAGGTAEEMSRLRGAAQLTGVSSDTLQTGMQKLAKSMEGTSMKSDEAAGKLYEQKLALEQQVTTMEASNTMTDAQKTKLAELKTKLGDVTEAYDNTGVAFNKYGIKVTDSNGQMLDTHSVLTQVAEQFKKMPNGAEKTAEAMALFGKKGADMIPFLNKGAAGIAELEKQSDKYGLTITDKQLGALAKSKEAHRTLDAAMQGLKIQVGAQLLPIMAQAAGWMSEHFAPAIASLTHWVQTGLGPALERFRPILVAIAVGFALATSPLTVLVGGLVLAYQHFEGFRNVVNIVVTWLNDVAMPAIAAFGQNVVAGFQVLVEWTRQHWDQIKAVIAGVIDTVTGIVKVAIEVLQGAWQIFGGTLKSFAEAAWGDIKHIFEAAFAIITDIFHIFKDLFHGDWGKLWDDVKSLVGHALDEVKALLGLAWDEMKAAVGLAWDGIKAAVQLGWSGIEDFVKSLPEKIGAAASGMWHGIVDAFHAMLGLLKSAWNSFADTFKFELPKVHIPGTSVDIGGGSVSLFPHLASGGYVRAVVGEHGPEVVALPAGASVFPYGTLPSGGGTAHVVVNLAGETIADVLVPAFRRQMRGNR